MHGVCFQSALDAACKLMQALVHHTEIHFFTCSSYFCGKYVVERALNGMSSAWRSKLACHIKVSLLRAVLSINQCLPVQVRKHQTCPSLPSTPGAPSLQACCAMRNNKCMAMDLKKDAGTDSTCKLAKSVEDRDDTETMVWGSRLTFKGCKQNI